MRWLSVVSLLCLLSTAASAEPVTRIRVVNDRAPDCSSLESIVRTVTRGCKTDDQRAIALYNFCRYDHYHHAYPSEQGGISALKLINVYGWGLCGGQHTVLAALWEAAGYPWRYRGWSNPGHTTVEVFYGDRWHYLDTFLKFYTWTDAPQFPGGRTIASQEDIRANPALVADAFCFDGARKVCYHGDNRFDYVGDDVNWTAPAFMVCGDTLEGVLLGVRNSRDSGSPRGWGGIRFDDAQYSTDVDLRPGYALTLDWNRVDDAFYFRGRSQGPHHTCGDKDYRNCPSIGPLLEPYHGQRPDRSWSNGRLVFRPDLRTAAALSGFSETENVVWKEGTLRPDDETRTAVVVAEMASPYVIAKAVCKIDCGDATIQWAAEGDRWSQIDPGDFSSEVAGLYSYRLRVTFTQPMSMFEIANVVQHNQESLPYLAPGANRITVTASEPKQLGDNRLVVTYAYCLGSREKTPIEMFEGDAEVARGHYATWSETPVVVQKTFDTLPATFDIPVPTPRGRQPVYPRMVFLRREVLAPGQSALPVPQVPSTPRVADDQYLADVPNPWRIGTGGPRTRDDRPTNRVVHAPKRLSYVSKQGEVFEHQFIKWLKDDSNAWILLADFELVDLPSARSLAAAKLILYVEEAHNEAAMQAAAVPLNAPFEVDRPFDFDQLGQVVGTTIVARGNGPGAPFVPARRYEIDVTRLLRSWSRGVPQHGLAVRIVPNRRVDDGWTVRFTPKRETPLELEILTFAESNSDSSGRP
jgi:hypothetical protein